MTSSFDKRQMLLLSLDGFERAYQRWEDARHGLDEAGSFAPLTECLWWADSIDERLEEIEGSSYRDRRDADPDGRLLIGIRWARNRTGHDQAMVLRYRPGAELGRLTLGLSSLGSVSQLLWRSVDELPPGRGRMRGRAEYRSHLQGRPVHGTITAVRRWFDSGARSFGSLTANPPER
jgi:hypothetical protein